MTSDHELVVASRTMTDLLQIAERAAKSPAKVLITGESGVGKDVVARFIHQQSGRKSAPFVAVNCAGVPETLLESELFGHVKGSFTGAYRDKRGKIQLAQNGTLFLDEVGEMSLRMQALLLRFLENGEVQSVGSDQAHERVDVRVIAATNRDLGELVASGQFREDLLYRLRVIHLHVPPLRERHEDVQVLTKHFLARAGRELTFSDDAQRAFQGYRWPGNVRELLNVVEQLVWLSPNGTIEVEHLPVSMRSASGRLSRLRIGGARSPTTCTMPWLGTAPHSGRMSIRCSWRVTSRGMTFATRSSRAARVARPLQGAGDAVRHVGSRLPPLHEFSGRSRLRGRFPRIPWLGPVSHGRDSLRDAAGVILWRRRRLASRGSRPVAVNHR